MIERFLLDRIDAESARTPIGEQLDRAVFDAAHKTQTALSLVHLAMTRADIALNAPVLDCVPVGSWMTHRSELAIKIALI